MKFQKLMKNLELHLTSKRQKEDIYIYIYIYIERERERERVGPTLFSPAKN